MDSESTDPGKCTTKVSFLKGNSAFKSLMVTRSSYLSLAPRTPPPSNNATSAPKAFRMAVHSNVAMEHSCDRVPMLLNGNSAPCGANASMSSRLQAIMKSKAQTLAMCSLHNWTISSSLWNSMGSRSRASTRGQLSLSESQVTSTTPSFMASIPALTRKQEPPLSGASKRSHTSVWSWPPRITGTPRSRPDKASSPSSGEFWWVMGTTTSQA
mmetsp:Transcript_124585/g.360304  ORF Transcript_124585/g.360304 Transcript_124585/m.360304 type:complete len:212 (-) Transcript_124585:960-1595(-)